MRSLSMYIACSSAEVGTVWKKLVRSNQVVPFQSVAPSARSGCISPPGRFSVGLNRPMCSNRCA